MATELKVLDLKADIHRGDGGFQQTGCSPDARCGNGLEKIYPTCAVRYGYMRYMGEFKYSPGMQFNCGGKVVIQTNRGIEIGEQISLTCSGCDKSVSRKQILDYAHNSGPEFLTLKSGRILRAATPADIDDQTHLNMSAAHKLRFARDLARNLELPMKFVTCEHLLGGERIIFHFMSEDRIDFRELVRQLAQEYHTRIEMHQVGARDEARLVADFEICGRECCCRNFLKKLRQVNMKMAKLQKATLDPTKVSGRCGRLRCCLRYEHEGYEELNKKLPKQGSRIRTQQGAATVKSRQILTQLLSVQYDGTEKWETVPIEDVLEFNLPRLEMPPQQDGPRNDRGGPRDRNRGDGPRSDGPRDRSRSAGGGQENRRDRDRDRNRPGRQRDDRGEQPREQEAESASEVTEELRLPTPNEDAPEVNGGVGDDSTNSFADGLIGDAPSHDGGDPEGAEGGSVEGGLDGGDDSADEQGKRRRRGRRRRGRRGGRGGDRPPRPDGPSDSGGGAGGG